MARNFLFFEKYFFLAITELHSDNTVHCSVYLLIFVSINPYVLPFDFQFVAFLLIGVAAAAKKAAIISSLPVVGGIIFCGVILLFIAIVGLYGAFKQHQIALFAYMVVLFSIFVIQFSVACASLAASTTDELDILGKVSYFYFLKFSAVCAVLLIQLPPFTFTRLLDSP